jgi:hypothetical protein
VISRVSSTLVVVVALLVSACRASPPIATIGDAQRVHVELAELRQGRAWLVTKCGNCHRPPMPTDHLAREWPGKLDEMSVRAGLDVRQRRVIELYLVAMAR